MKTCIDCSAYLPVPPEDLTESGICLNDEAFEPFVEDLLAGSIPASCQVLIEQKKFVADRPACPDFQESEIIEIDDDSPLGQELRRLGERGELTAETLENAIIEEGLRRTDWKTLPVDQYAKQLESRRTKERDAGISSLGAMIALGNRAAFQTLLQYLSSLGPPTTIKEVHLKKEILRQLGCWKDRSPVAPVLIQELGRTPSNNTTRQWISDILKFLERCPLEVVQDPLERMLSDKKFSFKLMRRVKEVLWR
ncbi:MAG: hypothetical protein AB1512_04145 [Thermodesulfobacteriota bacterium]